MIFVAIVQTLIPMILLFWLAFFPANLFLGYLIQILSVGVLLVTFALVGMWIIPPWWVAYLFGVIFVLVVLARFWRNSSKEIEYRSNEKLGIGVICVVVVFAAYGLYVSVLALKGRNPIEQEVVDIAMPLTEGIYLVAQGGSNKIVNNHYKTLDTSVPRFVTWRGQSMGLDIIKIDKLGLRADGLAPQNPEEYYTFGTPVLAPCNGIVVLAYDGVRDMPVPLMDRENKLGNYAIIECGDFFVVLAHFMKDSLLVSNGQKIKIGEPLGKMGNSGNSGEPHLHVHAQRGLPEGAPISGEPVALTINGKFYTRNDRIRVR